MPRSKHRRKPGGKAVAHPGRGKPWRPLNLDFAWPEDAGEQVVASTEDLPLFNWSAQAETAQHGEEKEEHAYARGGTTGLDQQGKSALVGLL